MSTQNPSTELRSYTEQQASSYIGMSRSYLRQARMDGQREKRKSAPPFIKIGRSVRYIKDDLDSWLNHFQRFEHLGQQL
jgi:predicted DNA-binding transcriptional regulator AlpA